MEVNDEGTKITLKQVAEKDQVGFNIDLVFIKIKFVSCLPKIA